MKRTPASPSRRRRWGRIATILAALLLFAVIFGQILFLSQLAGLQEAKPIRTAGAAGSYTC